MSLLVENLKTASVLNITKALIQPSTLRPVLGRCTWEELVRRATGETSVERVRALRRELMENSAFFEAVNERLPRLLGRRIGAGPWGGTESREALWAIVRILGPGVVVETGVFDGLASAFILQALKDNGYGRLLSVDLPTRAAIRDSTDGLDALPAGEDPGWVIPDGLRGRRELVLGDARQELEPLLKEVGSVDLFCHDSLHTYDHMMWEFRTVWPYLTSGGLLVSDDVFARGARGSFFRFCKTQGMEAHVFDKMGVARKP